jgi:alcohol dehydrogenase
VSCGTCPPCRRGLTSRCATTAGDGIIAAFGFGPATVHYLDDDPARRHTAASFGAGTAPHGQKPRDRYDIAVEATSRPRGLRRALTALAPGGVCTAVGYYLGTGTRVPLMRMYANDSTLHLGVSHPRTVLPDLLAFLARTGFPAERVTSLVADWDDAPAVYAARTTKLVLRRPRLAGDG